MRRIHSIRFKITSITIGVILAIALSILAVCYSSINAETKRHSVEELRMVEQEAQNTLDGYFTNIEQSVGMAANEAIDTLDSVLLVECGAAGSGAGLEGRTPEQNQRLDQYLADYCARIQRTFEILASHTNGAITYYYCINPEVSQTEHGFFYSRVGKAGFVEQEPLDARTLDPEDIEHTTWYYTPIERGRPSWVGPYTAHFLGEMWISSYLVPIYSANTLIGVLGMDISMDTIIAQVAPIRVYNSGFASLSETDGHIIYHPELARGTLNSLSGLSVSRELMQAGDSGDALIRYNSAGGERRQMSFTTLRNGMKLVVTAPVREINSSWLRLLRMVLVVTALAIVAYAVVLMLAVGVLTQPLRWLTAASKRLADADYDVPLTYRSRDEVGELTDAFRQMRDKQKEYVEDLNRRVYTDDLTGLPNMRRFFELVNEARVSMAEAGRCPAILYFNLIGLKHFNRQYGYSEGNNLICAAARILEAHYGHDRLCRVGQDHFAAIADEEGLEEELDAVFRELSSANEGRSLPMRVGVYRDSMEEVSVSTACDRAKYACDQRRNTVISGYTVFEDSMLQQVQMTRYVIEHLDQAIAEKWIQVYYQPLIRAVNSKVCDEEALSRWIDPEKGMLSPAQFIPALEDSGLIYKLDLYVLDQVLERIRTMQARGFIVVPQSINLSRSDFDTLDMVEEISRRVDAAGVSRGLITIEITESVIGSNFDFMKKQVERFQSHGFAVWMDDFGSGYSSLDMLQSIKFDLLKFDMSFMRKLNEGEDGKVILSKLMEMATAIGVDTVCEGVETEEQVHFLQEIGCSKLQGYYFSKPLPASEVLERNQTGKERFGFENPEESVYFEEVGRVNLYDLGVIASDEKDAMMHTFNTLPMGIVEVKGDTYRFMRSNQSYRNFVQRFFGIDITKLGPGYGKSSDAFMENVVHTCCEQGLRAFYDEKMPDGSTVHSFSRRISVNPVNGNVAVAVAVLSVAEPEEGASFADVARALATDYRDLYMVNLDTESFIEYSSAVGGDEMAVERHGERFFESVHQDARSRVYEEDLSGFLDAFSRENIIHTLAEQGAFNYTYRLVEGGVPVYANMKITRMPGGNRIIVGVSIIDAQKKQQEQTEALKQERDMMKRIMALSEGYLALFTVDPATGRYTECSSEEEYSRLGSSKGGEDFFQDSVDGARRLVCPEDLPRFIRDFTRENVLRQIRAQGSFIIQYRLMMGGEPRPVVLKTVQVSEGSENRLIVGVRAMHARQ